jgi:hypothetical protein
MTNPGTPQRPASVNEEPQSYLPDEHANDNPESYLPAEHAGDDEVAYVEALRAEHERTAGA